jgi:cell division protein FtsQ
MMVAARSGRGISARTYRLSTNDRQTSWRKIKRVLLAICLAVVLCSGAAGLTAWTRTASLFQLSTIHVGGNRSLSSQRALEMVPVEKGVNIFAVDLKAIEMSLEQDPRIRNVIIRRRLPSTIAITIREREPVMFISANVLLGLDEEGMVMPLEKGEEFQDIPVLTGVIPAVEPGCGGAHLCIQKGLEIRRAIAHQAPALWDLISEINVAQPEAPLLYLTQGGAQVQLGRDDLYTQVRRLWIVLNDLAAKGVAINRLDLRFKDQLVCQPAS